jgi:hypothetical protein
LYSRKERSNQSKYSYFNRNVQFQDDQDAQNQVSRENDGIRDDSFGENETRKENNDDTIINEDRPLINQNVEGLSNKHGSISKLYSLVSIWNFFLPKAIFFWIDDFAEITQSLGESNLPISTREVNQLFAITNKFEMVTKSSFNDQEW